MAYVSGTAVSHRGADVIGRLESINVGDPRTVLYRRRPVRTSIWKFPVDGEVAVRGIHVGSDEQSDYTVHGGVYKAVYAYALEDARFWSEKLERDLEPGTFGENLTVSGLNVSDAVVGEQWRIGSALLQVTEPRLPCFKLGIKMGDGRFPKRFGKAARFGAYLRIIEEGTVRAGDGVEVTRRPAHAIAVSHMGRMILGEHDLAERVLQAAGDMSDAWRARAAHIAGRRKSA